MQRVRMPVRKRMLIPILTVCWKGRGEKAPDKVLKSDLLAYKMQDLVVENQLQEARKQLDEYEASKQQEVRGRWNQVCEGCGYVNHERHQFCESCGRSLGEEALEVVHVCPSCRTRIPNHSRQCHDCGARFWSPIIIHQSEDGTFPGNGVEEPDEAPI
jgi:rRNA maturation endonuclease Nob1